MSVISPDVREPKRRWPREDALSVAEEILDALGPITERVTLAGSLRRGRKTVGDVEILYVPKFGICRVELFDEVVNLAERRIAQWRQLGILMPRQSKSGHEAWGRVNKLAVHNTGIPVDLFATQPECWWNYLVCRTGPAESNTRIAMAAQRRGWKWNPYGVGFTRLSDGEAVAMTSEEEVFAFVGLPYAKPEERT